jgi:hypothetical protein
MYSIPVRFVFEKFEGVPIEIWFFFYKLLL